MDSSSSHASQPVNRLDGASGATNRTNWGPLPPATIEFAAMAASTDETVVLYGETGTGKTWLARRIHELSARSNHPLVEVNATAIPDTLFEAEMFGHERGAFTGATGDRPGLMEAANGGTLLLDEVSELPLALQAKLLKAMDDHVVRRVGDNRKRFVDMRVIAATNRDLETMVREGRFRGDLYWRFAILEHYLPPLRCRLDALPALAEWFLWNALDKDDRPILDRPTLGYLQRHEWPGNLRELDNVIRYAALHCEDGVIVPADLPQRLHHRANPDDPNAAGFQNGRRYKAPDDPETEIHAIQEALDACGGNKTRAAKALGMARSTLHVKLLRFAEQLGI